MPELVGEIAPIARTNDDNDPGSHRIFCVEPNRWIAARTVVDPELFGLLIGEQGHAPQACRTHAKNNGSRVQERRPAPSTSKFQRSGEQCHASGSGACGGDFQPQQRADRG